MSLCLIYPALPQPTPFYASYSPPLSNNSVTLTSGSLFSLFHFISVARYPYWDHPYPLRLRQRFRPVGWEWQGRADPYLSELIHAHSSSNTTPFTLLFVCLFFRRLISGSCGMGTCWETSLHSQRYCFTTRKSLTDFYWIIRRVPLWRMEDRKGWNDTVMSFFFFLLPRSVRGNWRCC